MSAVLEWCNLCEKMKSSEDQSFELFFASCGHLICGQCRANLCPFCKKETTYVKLEELHDHLKLFFQDSGAMIKSYSKVIEFQNMQNSIVQQHVFHQNKKQQQQIADLQKQLKDKNKEYEAQLQLLKSRCSSMEHELEKQTNELQALRQINEKMSTEKRKIEESHNFYYKSNDETKSAFFDPSQLIKKPANMNTDKVSPYLNPNKVSPYMNTRNSDQLLANMPSNKPIRPHNKDNAKKKITYDNLEFFLK